MEKHAAFEQAVVAHGPRVLRVCRAVLGTEHDADDAWSETFLAALRAWPALPADANVGAWLVTIAHNKAVDVIRRRRDTAVEELPERPATQSDHAARLDLWAAVWALPQRQRHAVAYHYLGGLPYAEIAKLLGGTTDAARRAAADGMRTLRHHYRNVDTRGEG